MPDFLHADKDNFSDDELMQEEKIRPQSFRDFAGQRKTLDNLEVFVAAAKKQRSSARSRSFARTSRSGKNHISAYYCK